MYSTFSKRLFYTILILIYISSNVFGRKEAYTKEEQEKLKKFYPMVEHLLILNYQKEDAYLIQWLQRKNWNIQNAKEALETSLTYRKSHDLLDNLSEDKESEELGKLFFPTTVGEAISKEGIPAAQHAMASWDVKKAMVSKHKESISRFIFYMFESALHFARSIGVTQSIYLVDLNNFNRKQHLCLSCLSFYMDIINVYEKHFPNSAQHMILFNAPRVFESVLQVIKPLMTPQLKKIFKVFGHDKEEWQKYILELFDVQQLTPQYGGTKNNGSKKRSAVPTL